MHHVLLLSRACHTRRADDKTGRETRVFVLKNNIVVERRADRLRYRKPERYAGTVAFANTMYVYNKNGNRVLEIEFKLTKQHNVFTFRNSKGHLRK